MKRLHIIKIGGNVIDDPLELEKFLGDFSKITDNKILVHGGGKLADQFSDRLNIKQDIVNGRRVTNAETLDLTVMVYAGLINKQIVASLQSKKVNALGLSGADANLIKAKKREVTSIDYGFVGDLDAGDINIDSISNFLFLGITPVFSAITHDGLGQLLNTNADTIASTLAIALSKRYSVQLHYCFEKKGVLRDIEDENSVIDTISKTDYQELLAGGNISKGMIPKMENAFHAIWSGVEAVSIAHHSEFINTIKNGNQSGTRLIA